MRFVTRLVMYSAVVALGVGIAFGGSVPHSGVGGIVLLLIVVGLVLVLERQGRAREKAEENTRSFAREEGLKFWREEPPPAGDCRVTLKSVRKADVDVLLAGLSNLAQNPAIDLPSPEGLLLQVERGSPQTLVSGVGLEYAAKLRIAVRQTGAKVGFRSVPRRESAGAQLST